MIGMLLNVVQCQVHKNIPSNLSTMATLGTEESGRCREATVVNRFKQESMYGLSAQKSGSCREVAVVERGP